MEGAAYGATLVIKGTVSRGGVRTPRNVQELVEIETTVVLQGKANFGKRVACV